jgi:P4 family phage/plasmid primase-like protien
MVGIVKMEVPHPFLNFLTAHKATGEGNPTMTGMGNLDKGSYRVKPTEYDTFLDLMYDYVFVKKRQANLIEQHWDHGGPILIDLDFRYEGGKDVSVERRITSEQIYNFVLAYVKILCRYFEVEKFEKKLRFIVQMKPTTETDTKKDLLKDGIHINCPDITLEAEIQHGLRGALIQEHVLEKVFEESGVINPAVDIFDRAPIHRNGWFFHGCSKPAKYPYKNEIVFQLDCISADEINLVEVPINNLTNREYLSLLSIRKNHSEEDTLVVRPEMQEEWSELEKAWSAGDPKIIPPLTLTSGTTVALSESENSENDNISVRSPYTDDDIKMAFRLARECLNPMTRAKSYAKWVELALLLRNIGGTAFEKEAIETWVFISRKVPEYESEQESTFVEKWIGLRASHAEVTKQIKMGTLIHWVKQDNMKRYEDIRDEDNVDYAYNRDSGTHVEIANLVFRETREEYRCAPNQKGVDWFHYEGHAWRQIKLPMELRAMISGRIRNLYTKAERKANDIELQQGSYDNPEVKKWMEKTKKEIQEAADNGDASAQQFLALGSVRKQINEKKKKLMKVKMNLENSSFKDSVMKELTEKFYKEDFKDILDTKVNLVGLANGVLNLEAERADPDDLTGNTKIKYVEFRNGNPDDFISLQMGKIKQYSALSYSPYDENDPNIKKIKDFFSQLFPDIELRDYVLALLAACLYGRNKEQKFYIYTGEGSNGKSAILRFIEMVFGEYQTSTQATLVTRKQSDSGAAAPQIVQMRNKRFVGLQEPEEGERINTSLMKQLSGEDMISARGLYKDTENFAITGRIFLCCNNLPPVSSIDNGTWRRLRVIFFGTQFWDAEKFKGKEGSAEWKKDVESKAKENIFPKDEDVEKYGFPAWRQSMLSLLVHIYETVILKVGLKEPNCVTNASSTYKKNNDSFSSYMEERLIKDAGAQTREKDIMKDYKNWLAQEPEKKALTAVDIRRKMVEKYGKPIVDKKDGKEAYRGVRIAIEGEDVSGNFIDLPPPEDEPSVEIIPPDADAAPVAPVTEVEEADVIELKVKKQPKKKKPSA